MAWIKKYPGFVHPFGALGRKPGNGQTNKDPPSTCHLNQPPPYANASLLSEGAFREWVPHICLPPITTPPCSKPSHVWEGIVIALNWAWTRYAGFLAQAPEGYAEDGPVFDIRTHLNGPIICEGVIYGPTGRVSSRFVGEFDCHWDGNRSTMQEVFHYDDGSQQTRAWDLTLRGDGEIRVLADDVVGEGTGRQAGGAVQLKYRFRLPEKSGGHVLNTVDWMYLAPNRTIVNRSQFRKYGVKVAELVATMRPARAEELKEAA